MTQQPATCQGCSLYDNHIAIGFQQPEGLGTLGVLVVAEALGEREAADSLPLRPNAPAGSVFQGLLRRISGLDRSQLLLSNILWCRPGVRNWLDGAPYEHSAIAHCSQYNRKLIQDRRPRVILALGAIPARTITGMSGYNQGIKLIRGFVLNATNPSYFVDGTPLPVVATYHPSFLLRASKTRSKDKEGGKVEKAEGGMALSGVCIRDIQFAMEIAKYGPPAPHKFEVIKGNREVMDELIRQYKLHPEWDLYWDIETPRSLDKADDESEIDSIQAQVTQIQFAYDDKRGYVFPGFATEYVKEGTAKLLSLPNRKVTWNGKKFDNKVVQGHHQIPILGEDLDLMQAWHWIQPDLPQGLQFATSFHAPGLKPWKHLAFDEEDLYGACDVISLPLNLEGIFDVMQKRGLATSFDRHCQKLGLELVSAQHRGFPLDPEKHEKFGRKINEEIEKINASIQARIPEAILTLEPRRKSKGNSVPEFGYVNTPKQILLWLDDQGNPKDGSDRITIREEIPIEDDDGNPTEGTEIQTVVYVRRSVEVFNKETLETENVLRWCRLKSFSVGSPTQKIRYIEFRREEEITQRMAKGQDRAKAERLAKHAVPKVRNKQKELKDNTGAKELEKLFKETGDLVYQLLVEISKLKKLSSTYYKGWQIKKDGKLISPDYVHTTFGPANTGTGQLSSVDPNIQNAPKHSDLAKGFRGCICAKPGRRLIEIDKKSFHAQTLAFEAKDKAYARLSAIDVHSYMTAFRLKLPDAPKLLSWSDGDLKAWIKEKKNDPTIYKAEAVPNYPHGLTFQQVRDYKSKRVILGIGFKQGALSILEQNPESYKNKAEVQEFIDLFGMTFGGVPIFQNDITQLAHKQTHLISRWGYIRRFYDVFKWEPNKWNRFTGSMGDWGHGDDFEAAVAFLPANDAFGMLKEEMLRLVGYRLPKVLDVGIGRDFIIGAGAPANAVDEIEKYKKTLLLGWKQSEDLFEKYNFTNQIHDSLIFHCDNGLVDRCLEDVIRIMREPCPTLYWAGMENEGLAGWTKDGLFVDAEAMVGDDWAHMEVVKV